MDGQELLCKQKNSHALDVVNMYNKKYHKMNTDLTLFTETYIFQKIKVYATVICYNKHEDSKGT